MENEKVKFTNEMFYGFQQNPALAKLIGIQSLPSDKKFKLFKLIRIVGDSPEMKAYQDMMREIVEAHEKEQEEIATADDKYIKVALLANHPKIVEVHKIESGLEIEKITLEFKALPEELLVADMLALAWLIDIKEEEACQE